MLPWYGFVFIVISSTWCLFGAWATMHWCVEKTMDWLGDDWTGRFDFQSIRVHPLPPPKVHVVVVNPGNELTLGSYMV
jgi:hypothetical protein